MSFDGNAMHYYHAGFYLGFEIWGEAIVDNVAVGGGYGEGDVPPPA